MGVAERKIDNSESSGSNHEISQETRAKDLYSDSLDLTTTCCFLEF